MASFRLDSSLSTRRLAASPQASALALLGLQPLQISPRRSLSLPSLVSSLLSDFPKMFVFLCLFLALSPALLTLLLFRSAVCVRLLCLFDLSIGVAEFLGEAAPFGQA